ncbi:MAG: oligopeptide ABC transporter ATP-binding protein OppD [Burkholderiales bacterium]|nr:oligopeptide ABC transporter ATP-binding protein OppD [Burkholderiales bacterium]
MLEVKNIVTEIETQEGTIRAVDDLSLTIAPREIYALVGESGCGKSMTALSLLRLLPETGRVSSGVVTVDGTEIMGLPESMMRHIRASKISLIFQEPGLSLNPVMTIGDQILETIYLHTSLRGQSAKSKVLDWLNKVGIPEPEKRIDMFPHEISGGQKQRVMIALALAAEPGFLIADEPTTALDVTIQAQILNLLKEIRDSEGIGILLISHDLAVVAQVADKVGLMYAGEMVEEAEAKSFFKRPFHPYARTLLRALPDGKRKTERLDAIPGVVPPLTTDFKGCRFAERCSEAREECKTQTVKLHDLAGHRVRCLFPIEEKVVLPLPASAVETRLEKRPAVLELQNYNVWFPNRGSIFKKKSYFKAVKDVNFAVKKGLTTALVGESGSGKTTVARGVLQLLRGQAFISGEARLEGVDLGAVNEQELKTLRKKMQIVFQDPFSSLNPRMRVQEVLLEGLESLHPEHTRGENLDRIAEMLKKCGLRTDSLYRYPHEFSGGQRQRLAIARALVVEPELLICDEPTSALDVSVQAQILNLLNDIQKERGLSYLFITHNFGVVQYLSDEIVVMKSGEIVETGPASQVLNSPAHSYTQKLLEAVPHFRPSVG